jgi:spermidine/putrescine transport system ATP-binding protein
MLEIVNISKSFSKSSTNVLSELNLKINEGEFFSLLGSSGCGKTTLLRILAGFESPDSGDLRLNSESIINWSAQKRPFNMVFQRYALFPHYTVFDNVAFGLRMKKVSESEVKSRVQSALELTNLRGLAERWPETLSGGQAQRVALARALVNQPKVLLLDEPLSALDLKMREHMQTELRELQKRLGLTFIYVTHDQEEAFALSDRVAVMNKGCIEQIGSPTELYLEPESLYSARFVGDMSEISLQKVYASSDKKTLIGEYHDYRLRGRKLSRGEGAPVLMVRPEKIQLIRGAKPTEDFNSLEVRFIRETFKGSRSDILVQTLTGDRILISISGMSAPSAVLSDQASPLWIQFSPEETFIYAGDN